MPATRSSFSLERTSFGCKFRPWILPSGNGRSYFWSTGCSRLPGRHSLQYCNSGGTFLKHAQVAWKAPWQRITMLAWEMLIYLATSGLLGTYTVQWRNSLRSQCQCPDGYASATWHVHITFVSWLCAFLRQRFATQFCYSCRTAVLSHQERQPLVMGSK